VKLKTGVMKIQLCNQKNKLHFKNSKVILYNITGFAVFQIT